MINVAEEPGRPAVIRRHSSFCTTCRGSFAGPDSDHRDKIVFISQGFDRVNVENMIAMLDRVATRTTAERTRAQADC